MSLDTVATVALAVVTLSAVVGICRTEPGALVRALGGAPTGRHVRPATTPRQPHARPLVHHAAPRGWSAAAGSPLAICAPAGDTEPSPAVTATPDIHEFVRTS